MTASGMYSGPVADVIARLDHHTRDVGGRILRGYDWTATPVREGESADSLPAIRLFAPDIRETFRAARLVTGTLEISVQVAVAREQGLVALMRAVESVADALQTGTDGAVSALAGTAGHFDFRTEGNFAVDSSLNAHLIVSVTPAARAIGRRRL